MADQTEGRAVREALDGPEIDYDTFISHHEDQRRHEDSAASTMGEARQARGDFLEETGLNGKAVSAIRAGLKIKDEAKRQSWLRSLKALMPIAESHINGNTTIDWIEVRDDEPEDGAPNDEAPADLPEDIQAESDEFDEAVEDLGKVTAFPA